LRIQDGVDFGEKLDLQMKQEIGFPVRSRLNELCYLHHAIHASGLYETPDTMIT
jgi:hypothetical protein